MDTYEMKTPVQTHVTSANGDNKASSLDRDQRDLARLGKKQVLKVSATIPWHPAMLMLTVSSATLASCL